MGCSGSLTGCSAVCVAKMGMGMLRKSAGRERKGLEGRQSACGKRMGMRGAWGASLAMGRAETTVGCTVRDVAWSCHGGVGVLLNNVSYLGAQGLAGRWHGAPDQLATVGIPPAKPLSKHHPACKLSLLPAPQSWPLLVLQARGVCSGDSRCTACLSSRPA